MATIRRITNKKFTDLDPIFIPHPTTGDVTKIVNEVSVKTSIKSLIRTTKGERLFQPDVGTNLNSLLFEPMHQGTSELIKYEIENVISKYEPRVKLNNVLITPFQDKNSYDINLEFTILGFSDVTNIQFLLERTR